LREALVASSASNWALASRIEKQSMPWAEKDMTIVLKEADSLRISVPLYGVVKEVVKIVKFEHNWPPHAPDDEI
jgi:3-hydroxyisobutyrate dehydrogenase-like beta-hydroxyacid dehydrogenase